MMDLPNHTGSGMNGEFRNRSLDQYKSTRTALHDKRTEISKRINRDLLIKRGASNLADVSRDKKAREKALKEINEMNLDLQNMKTELDRLNCSFADYQTNSGQLPMVPIGMKDTEPVDFTPFFLRFLEEHYYADPVAYRPTVEDITKLRNSIVVPSRSEKGITEHKQYYSLLTVVDHRFFAKEVRRDFFFHWNDSFTGVAFKQVSLAFEKGSVLFNLGALYSQIATACKRDTAESLQEASRLFTQGARIFRMLKENFSYAPSPDMSSVMLSLLIQLLMLQAQECGFLEFSMNPKGENENYQRLGIFIGQAIALSTKYEKLTHSSTSSDFEVLPSSWTGMFEIKGRYYRAQAYYRFAAALLGLVMFGNEADNNGPDEQKQIDQQIEQELNIWMTELNHVVRFTQPINNDDASSVKSKRSGFASLSKKTGAKAKTPKRSQSVLGSWRKTSSQSPKPEDVPPPAEEVPIQIPRNRYEACQVGIACLREAINYMEEVMRIIRLNDELKRQEILTGHVSRLLDDWKYQKQQLQPTLEMLQKKFAPDQPLEDGMTNGDGTLRGRKKVRKSTSSASQYAKRSSLQSNNNFGSQHVAPRLLASPSEEANEAPSKIVFQEDFPQMEDPFLELGPLEVFNARNYWTKSITVRLRRDPVKGYGFCIKGNAPIEIVSCEEGSPADLGGLRAGDLVVGLNGHSAHWLLHDEAVELVKEGMAPSKGAPCDNQLVELIVVRAAKAPVQNNGQGKNTPTSGAHTNSSSMRS